MAPPTNPSTSGDPSGGGESIEAGPAIPVTAGADRGGRRLALEIIGAAIVFGAPMAGLWAIACWVDFGLPRNRPAGCPRGGPGLLVIFPALWLAVVAWRVLAMQRRRRTLRPPPLGRFSQVGFEPSRLASVCLLAWGFGMSVWGLGVMGRSWLHLLGGTAVVAAVIGVAAVCARAGVPHVHRFVPADAASRRCDRCGKDWPPVSTRTR